MIEGGNMDCRGRPADAVIAPSRSSEHIANMVVKFNLRQLRQCGG
jgi:hypothetical protein